MSTNEQTAQSMTGDRGVTADLGGPLPAKAGVGLEEYCAYRRTRHRPAVWDATKKEAWVYGPAATLHRLPHEHNGSPSAGCLRALLRQKGIWLVTWETTPEHALPANCFEYVCRGPNYSVEQLDTHARRDVRRGLRHFQVRRTSVEEIAECGYRAQRDTDERHRYAVMDHESFRRSVFAGGRAAHYEHWAAWSDGEIAAYMGILKIGDWAMVGGTASANAHLRNCPNNALCYLVTRQMLAVERRAYVTYGLSALRAGSNELAMHKYKTRMGYVAEPRLRCFEVHPLLRPMVVGPWAKWVWRRVLQLRPKSRALNMVVGLTDVLQAEGGKGLEWLSEGAPCSLAGEGDKDPQTTRR